MEALTMTDRERELSQQVDELLEEKTAAEADYDKIRSLRDAYERRLKDRIETLQSICRGLESQLEAANTVLQTLRISANAGD